MTDVEITKEQVEHLASLAQLELTDAELEKFSGQLSAILQYVDRIKEVELSGDIKRNFKKVNTFREDENPHEAGEHAQAIMEAMPEVEKNMLKVKKILNN